MISFTWIQTVGMGIACGALLRGALSAPARAQAPAAGAAVAGAPRQFWVYIGNNSADGIGLFKLDTEKGALTGAGIAAPANKPGFLAIAPNQKWLFAGVTNAAARAGMSGAVQGFSIDAATGKLTAINSQASEGDEPTFVTVDPVGKNVLVAHYNTAIVSVLPIDAEGKLAAATSVLKQTGSSVDPQRQTHAYAHSINCSPDGKFAICCDLGADKLFIYKLDSTAGKIFANDPPSVSVPAGSGPRHLTFHPNGKFVYALTEMGGTVVGFNYDAQKGGLAQFQVITALKNNEKGNGSAEVQIDPSGRFLYASNRLTTNYVTVFSIDQATGQLTVKGFQDCLGETPRNFRIDPTGHFMVLANQDSNTVVLLSIDQQTGLLTPVGQPIATVRGPICVKFVAVAGG